MTGGAATPAAGGVGDGTLVAQAGLAPAEPGRPLAPGPVFAAPYHLDPEAGPRPGLDGYGRTDNPSWRALEAAIATLEAPEGLALIDAAHWATEQPWVAVAAEALTRVMGVEARASTTCTDPFTTASRSAHR